MNLRHYAFALAGLLPLHTYAAANPDHVQAIIDEAVRPMMAEFDVPGMAIAVTVHGKSMFFNYGLASREDQTPVDERTLFELGSVSKTFTATLAAQAIDQGKLSLADHPGKFLPALKGHAIDRATMLHLGTYSAGGLPLQLPDDVADDAQLVRYYQHWKPAAAPGKLREYSNPSLGLFGRVTALALKQDFTDVMQNRLFPQLGLHSTYMRVPAAAMSHYAWGYKVNQPGRVHEDEVLAPETYGVKSNAADMIRYVQLNIDPAVLDAPVRRAIEGTHVGYLRAGELVQGLGWEQYSWPISQERLLSGNSEKMIWERNPMQLLAKPQLPVGPTLFNKTGSTSNFGAYVAFVPAQRIGVVILANRNYPIPARVTAGYAILEQLAKLHGE
ncbi:class C beta-lactamase [Rugamonas apoptosis]|uniref:class C beta-lactamase n=1 Tax=Rugamonas apoptosis TaxID=2758570 RepID=UPI001E44C781|nr:class C beta-lactamase [Rugamonas apoptosis]